MSFSRNWSLRCLVAFLGTSATVNGTPLRKRDVVNPLPENADANAIKFQPVMDYDTDSCYNTAAVDAAGNLNAGLQKDYTGVAENCREVNRLDSSNVYSRQRCNNGICAIMYEFYFEKDVVLGGAPVDAGHRHDWENVVVFFEGDQIKMVAPSCHSTEPYKGRTETPLLHEGTHPKVVYHKDGGSTHCIRMANTDDDAIENEKGVWFRSPLVGWNGWPSTGLRDAVGNNWSGGVGPKIDDIAPDEGQTFGGTLNKAQGGYFPQFDPYLDE